MTFLRDHFRREPFPLARSVWRIVAGPNREQAWIVATPRAGTFAGAGWHDPEKWKPAFRRDHPHFVGSDGSSP
jgi:hypothetical protein